MKNIIESAKFDVVRAEDLGGTLFKQGYITVNLTVASANNQIAPFTLQSTVTSRQTLPYVQ